MSGKNILPAVKISIPLVLGSATNRVILDPNSADSRTQLHQGDERTICRAYFLATPG
jgi:hypothetical protein